MSNKDLTPSQKEMKEAADKLPVAIDANVLYNEFIGMTNIEQAGEEDYVLDRLMKGDSKSKIIKNLSAKYKDKDYLSFSHYDFEKFLARNQAIVKAMGKEVSLTAKRHLEAKENVADMLAGIAMYTQSLVKDLRAEGDNTNTVGAIRALNTTLQNYMRLEGYGDPDNMTGNVQNVVNIVSQNKGSLRDKINRANFVEGKVKDEEE